MLLTYIKKAAALSLSSAITLVYTACGSENSTNPSNETISGTVVSSSYIQGATVCLDTNNNNTCDSGEPSTLTDANGSYSITADSDSITQHRLIAYAGDGASNIYYRGINYQEEPLQITTPIGETLLSPLATLIQHEMSKGATEDEAKSIIAAKTEIQDDAEKIFSPDAQITTASIRDTNEYLEKQLRKNSNDPAIVAQHLVGANMHDNAVYFYVVDTNGSFLTKDQINSAIFFDDVDPNDFSIPSNQYNESPICIPDGNDVIGYITCYVEAGRHDNELAADTMNGWLQDIYSTSISSYNTKSKVVKSSSKKLNFAWKMNWELCSDGSFDKNIYIAFGQTGDKFAKADDTADAFKDAVIETAECAGEDGATLGEDDDNCAIKVVWDWTKFLVDALANYNPWMVALNPTPPTDYSSPQDPSTNVTVSGFFDGNFKDPLGRSNQNACFSQPLSSSTYETDPDQMIAIGTTDNTDLHLGAQTPMYLGPSDTFVFYLSEYMTAHPCY